jgi:hypothetical protein
MSGVLDTVQVIDAWITQRGRQRALPHPRDGRLTEFLFLEHGRRPTSFRLRKGLLDAVAAAGLRGRDGQPLHVTPHQLRHTFGTSLNVRGIASDASFGSGRERCGSGNLRIYRSARGRSGSRLTRLVSCVDARHPSARMHWVQR